jgi:hypothetical protein
MALEIRPLPVLKGKIAKDFFKKAAECEESMSREEVRKTLRWVRRTIEEARERETREKEEVKK